MSLELTVRQFPGPKNLTFVLRHHPAIELLAASPGAMTQAAHKSIALDPSGPGRVILRVDGARGALASGTLAVLDFAVDPTAPARSSVFVESVVILGQPGARVGTIGATLKVQ